MGRFAPGSASNRKSTSCLAPETNTLGKALLLLRRRYIFYSRHALITPTGSHFRRICFSQSC